MTDLPHRPMRILRERKVHGPAVDALVAAAFGPDRMNKTVYKLREGVKPTADLCFVALDDTGELVASLRFWPISINGKWPATLLGPLAVAPDLRGLGYGKALMWHSLARCRELAIARVILVGDPEYYRPFGFRRDLALHLQLPGWVEDRRFLALETIGGSMLGVHGMIEKAPPARLRKPQGDAARRAGAGGKIERRRASSPGKRG